MDAILLDILISLLISWVFGAKILPQIVVIFLDVYLLTQAIQDGVTTSEIGIFLLIATVIIYSSLQIYEAKLEGA